MVDPTHERTVTEHPGKMLRRFMDERGWTGEELATITGFGRVHLSNVMSGKAGVSADMAVALAAAFGNTAADWLRWNAEFQLSMVSINPDEVMFRASIHSLVPIREMQRRGWILETASSADTERELDRFFGGSVRDGIPVLPVAPLKSDPLSALNSAEKAWCFKARDVAQRCVHVAMFDKTRLGAAEKKLRQLAAYQKEAERLPEMLAYYGIRFVVVEPLAGARIDGATFWIGESPVIAVSLRWDRIDAFWFTVMHEFMHIKNGDAYSFDVNLLREEGEFGIAVALSDNTAEERANAGAANALVPSTELDHFIRRSSPKYAAVRIVQFANRIKMHPGIIVGQLQHRREVKYSAHREFLVKVRRIVADSALTDGWGHIVKPSQG